MKKIKCLTCNGKGILIAIFTKNKNCPMCDGTGKVKDYCNPWPNLSFKLNP